MADNHMILTIPTSIQFSSGKTAVSVCMTFEKTRIAVTRHTLSSKGLVHGFEHHEQEQKFCTRMDFPVIDYRFAIHWSGSLNI